MGAVGAGRRAPTEASPSPPAGAILLAGGRASRVGGAAKPLFEIAGTTLLQRAVDAVAGCHPVTVVGDRVDGLDREQGAGLDGEPHVAAVKDGRGAGGTDRITGAVGDPRATRSAITWVREDPPFGGPAAAVVAALRSWAGVPGGLTFSPTATAPGWTYLLACDMPGVAAAVARVAAALPRAHAGTDGLCLMESGTAQPQWLAGVYRTSALLRAAQALPGEGRGASVRALLAGIAVEVVPAPADETFDVDTWEDLASARQRAAEQTTVHSVAVARTTSTSTSTSTSDATTTLDGGTP